MPRLVNDSALVVTRIRHRIAKIFRAADEPCEFGGSFKFLRQRFAFGRGHINYPARVMFAKAGRGAGAKNLFHRLPHRELAFDDLPLIRHTPKSGNQQQNNSVKSGRRSHFLPCGGGIRSEFLVAPVNVGPDRDQICRFGNQPPVMVFLRDAQRAQDFRDLFLVCAGQSQANAISALETKPSLLLFKRTFQANIFAKSAKAAIFVPCLEMEVTPLNCARPGKIQPRNCTTCRAEPDHRELRIDKVGVRGLRFPIQVRDKARSIQNTVATIGMFVDLPKEFKGTHMSRFVEVLNAHGSVIHVENIREILLSLQKKLNSATSHLEIEFPYFMSKSSPVSRGESLMDYVARFDASACGNDIDFVLTVKANVTTLCPCSKAIAKYGAHNQRGLVTVAIRMRKSVWIEDLVTMIESSASSELYALLKRQDEKFVTERAYENPVFVEDLVRNVALKLNAHPEVPLV